MDTQPLLILLVDDEKAFREIFSARLKMSGFEITEASGGKEALQRLKEVRPALVLLDLEMPEMDGVEVLSRMKQDQDLKNIKVIFLTNYGETRKESAWADEKFAREVGAVDYIKKTDDLDKIAKEVEGYILDPSE